MEIKSFVTLSTAHVSAETANSLDHDPCYFTGDYGWFVYAHDENDGTIPDDLWRVMCWAKAQNIHHILFDRDAEAISELPTYEW